ncbi:hypothetical protein HanRHA438_Chr03g0115321 [Helianthus annuus]|nr:hypothetical protein HanRHA438_Chr03g0115321 [Helianthus annuus]
MGDFKLMVNIARFATENKESFRQPEKSNFPARGIGNIFNGNGKEHQGRPQPFRVFASSSSGTSYKDSLLGTSKGDFMDNMLIEVSQFVKPLGEWGNKSLIVRVKDLSTMVKLDSLLLDVVCTKVALKYVGGLYMLLVFDHPEEMNSFLVSNPNVKVWFSWAEVWNGKSLPFERIAWLKVSGVPLHLLDNEVFDSIGRKFGKVVHVSSLSNDDKDFSYDMIGVLVGDGKRIMGNVNLVWKEKKFVVWVEEEVRDWIPDSIAGDV